MAKECQRCGSYLKLTNGLCRECGLSQPNFIVWLGEYLTGFFIAPILCSINNSIAEVTDKKEQKRLEKDLKPIFRKQWRYYLFGEHAPLLKLSENEVKATECRKCSNQVTNQVYCPSCNIIWPRWEVDKGEHLFIHMSVFCAGLICIHDYFMPVFPDSKRWQGNFDSMPFIGYYFYGAKTAFGNPVIDYLLANPAYICAILGLTIGILCFTYFIKKSLLTIKKPLQQKPEETNGLWFKDLADDIEQAMQEKKLSSFYISWELIKMIAQAIRERELVAAIFIFFLTIYWFIRFDKNLEETTKFKFDDLIGDIEEIRQRENLPWFSVICLYLKTIFSLITEHKQIRYQALKGLIISVGFGLLIGWLLGKGALFVFNPLLVTYTACVFIGGVLALYLNPIIAFFINTAVLSRHSRIINS